MRKANLAISLGIISILFCSCCHVQERRDLTALADEISSIKGSEAIVNYSPDHENPEKYFCDIYVSDIKLTHTDYEKILSEIGGDNIVAFRISGESGNLDGLVRFLGRCPNIRELYLGKQGIADADLVFLSDMTDLEFLRLEGNQINGDGLGNISSEKLLFLNLSENPLIRTKNLQKLKSLKELWLYCTPMSKSDIAETRLRLPTCKIAYSYCGLVESP